MRSIPVADSIAARSATAGHRRRFRSPEPIVSGTFRSASGRDLRFELTSTVPTVRDRVRAIPLRAGAPGPTRVDRRACYREVALRDLRSTDRAVLAVVRRRERPTPES